jgi:hypothetical protein
VNNEAPCNEDVLGSGGIAAHNLATAWECVVSFVLQLLRSPRGKLVPVPIGQGLDGPQNQS